MMEIESLFRRALELPSNAIGHHVHRELSDLFPERAILYGTDPGFELEEYAQTMEIPFEADHNVFRHVMTEWEGHGLGTTRETAGGWYRVEWEGHALEVGLLSWSDGSCEQRYHWILAPTQRIAEKFLCAVCDWAAEVRGEVLVFDRGYWSKSDKLYEAIQSATFDNLILPTALKEEIQTDFRQFFASREVYERYRIPWKRGVLFLGPPGNGKTHTVKALINQLGKPCLYVKSFKARYSTEHETIHAVFERARQTTPCLLVLEDLDSLINDRNRSFFLNELDGFANNTGVVVIASTNHPEKLDPAILDRPSRFDRKYTFAMPAPEEREAYIAHWNTALEPDMRLSGMGLTEIVALTEGFSFAYLKELFLSSMMRWIAAPQSGQMDTAMRSQVLLLRQQMRQHAAPNPEPPSEDSEDEE
jgi:DNA polymerase III delta prime subunit